MVQFQTKAISLTAQTGYVLMSEALPIAIGEAVVKLGRVPDAMVVAAWMTVATLKTSMIEQCMTDK